MLKKRKILLIIGIIGSLILLTPVFNHLFWEEQGGLSKGDLNLYHQYVSKISEEEIPYQDFNLEYPPAAIYSIFFPSFFATSLESYGLAFKITAFITLGICLLLNFILIFSHVKKISWQTVSALPLLSILLGPIVLTRFDLFPALLTLVVLFLLINKHSLFSWIILGLAVCTKIYPLVLVPPFLMYELINQPSTKQRKAIKFCLVGLSLGIILPALPFLINSEMREGIKYFFSYHLQRGFEIGSLWTSLIGLLHLWGLPATVSFEYGSQNIHFNFEYPILKTIPFFTATILIFIYFYLITVFKRAVTAHQRQILLFWSSFLVILALILCNKVFSPQFLIWLIVLFPLLSTIYSNNKFGQLLFHLAVICFLTFILFPVLFGKLKSLDENVLIILLIRNLLLVWLFIRLLPNPLSTNVKIKTQ